MCGTLCSFGISSYLFLAPQVVEKKEEYKVNSVAMSDTEDSTEEDDSSEASSIDYHPYLYKGFRHLKTTGVYSTDGISLRYSNGTPIQQMATPSPSCSSNAPLAVVN